jgi:hypothetical protein
MSKTLAVVIVLFPSMEAELLSEDKRVTFLIFENL